MQKVKSFFGLSLIAAAFTFAIATSANADKLYRWDPTETLVQPEECPGISLDHCANIFTDDDQPTGEIQRGTYVPN